MPVDLIPLLLLSPVMLATGYSDLRRMRIPNALTFIAIMMFLLSSPMFLDSDEVLLRLLAAGIAFSVGFTLFCLGMLGGGDVKIFSVLLLYIPSHTLSLFLLLFSGTMSVGILLVYGLRGLSNANTNWSSLRPGAGFPMGISIAMAGLGHPVLILTA